MTKLDEATHPTSPGTDTAAHASSGYSAAVAIVLFLIGLAGGSYQGKLADVQKNDNSSFLPGSADSTKVANAQEKFSNVQTIPGFVVYQRMGGLTAADKAEDRRRRRPVPRR